MSPGIEREFRIAMIGCGAVTELAHLPAARRVRECRVTLLVDPDTARREQLAHAFAVPHTAADAAAFANSFDGAIVAVPHALHAPITLQLAGLGKAILVEKPMANTGAECSAMIEAAQTHGVTLGVGLMRRFLWAHRFARELITSGVLGRVRSFDVADGAIYYWPVASDFLFRREAAGGGVLIDAGAHTLDTLLHWLGPVADLEYFDDAEGGIEANCVLNLRMQSGASGSVELSRTRWLRNTAIIRMENAVLEIALAENRLKISLPDHPYAAGDMVSHRDQPAATQDYPAIMASQLQDWVAAARTGRQPFVDGRAAMESVRLIEACYGQRQPLVLPWDAVAVTPGQ
jgi:predicted dehydrogenase